MADINVTEEIIDINVTEQVIVIEAPSGGYPLPASISSVFGRTGTIVATIGDYNTSLVTENTNLYFTNARARSAISLTTTGTSGAATYNNTTGVFNIPQYQGGVTSFNTRTGAISLTSADVSGALTYVPYNSSNPSGYISGITSGNVTTALGYTPVTNARTLTINGTTYDLTADRSWTITAGAVSSVFGRTGAVVATSGDYNTSQVTENTNLYYTEGRVSANTDVAANTAARHAAVTIGTANGLSLSTQALSLAAASTSTTGALTSTDWNTFNGKQAALNGTGFVKISGTTISYDNTSYLPLGGGTLTGGLSGTTATFSGILTTPQVKAATSAGLSINANSGTQVADFGAGGSANITFFGGLSGTSASFSSSVTASSLIKSGGTSAQILAADGSVITAGTNITISGGTISSSGGGGSISLAAIGSSPNANAATLTGTVLNLEPASASFGGIITTGTQSFAGAKTFSNDITILGILNVTVTTNRQTASYTLVLADRGKLVEMNVATANNLTIPLNSSVAFPVGTQIDLSQYGAGQTTVVATGGVTIRSTNSWVKLNARYAAATLIKIGTDEWYLFGNLNA